MRQVAVTSIQSRKELEESGLLAQRRLEVYNALRDLRYATDREVAQHLGYADPNAVRPRRKELVDMGLIAHSLDRECNVSHIMVTEWAYLDEPNWTKMGIYLAKRDHKPEPKKCCPLCMGVGTILNPQIKLAGFCDG
jgi:hypothetical protein